VIDNRETDAIEPASATDEVSGEFRISSEEYGGIEFNPERVQRDDVLVRVKMTGRRSETTKRPGLHIKT